jgi:site-specific DNA recombinase
MQPSRVAIYARVSDPNAPEGTIASQVAALEARLAQDGVRLEPECRFVDDGYTGATLVRPALERLRDAVAAGALDRLYVHCPDRLARHYAYQVLLIDEFRRAGVEVVFLNRAIGTSPEDDLLLQVQGMVAEYERAKIRERSRRGKRHAAAQGVINVLSGAPYGYHYVNRHAGGGAARYEVREEEAAVVRQIFRWIGQLSIDAVCRRLQQLGQLTRTGKTRWDRKTIWGILRNPAYIGSAAFGKTRVATTPTRLRPIRGAVEQPRHASRVSDVPAEEWIRVPVPALVEPELFDAVQAQLAENRARSRQRAGVTCSKGCWSASSAAMPTMATVHCGPENLGVLMPITAAAAVILGVLVDKRSAAIPRSGPTVWMPSSGRRSSGCYRTPAGLRASTSAAWMRRTAAVLSGPTSPHWRPKWLNCAVGLGV